MLGCQDSRCHLVCYFLRTDSILKEIRVKMKLSRTALRSAPRWDIGSLSWTNAHNLHEVLFTWLHSQSHCEFIFGSPMLHSIWVWPWPAYARHRQNCNKGWLLKLILSVEKLLMLFALKLIIGRCLLTVQYGEAQISCYLSWSSCAKHPRRQTVTGGSTVRKGSVRTCYAIMNSWLSQYQKMYKHICILSIFINLYV